MSLGRDKTTLGRVHDVEALQRENKRKLAYPLTNVDWLPLLPRKTTPLPTKYKGASVAELLLRWS